METEGDFWGFWLLLFHSFSLFTLLWLHLLLPHHHTVFSYLWALWPIDGSAWMSSHTFSALFNTHPAILWQVNSRDSLLKQIYSCVSQTSICVTETTCFLLSLLGFLQVTSRHADWNLHSLAYDYMLYITNCQSGSLFISFTPVSSSTLVSPDLV